jgi:hypothetical protein
MKKVLLVLFLSLSILNIQAQNFKITFSALSSYSRYAQIKEAAQVDNNLFVILSDGRGANEYRLNIYDNNNLELKSSAIFKQNSCKEANCIDKHFDYVKTLFLNKRVVILFQTYERSSKTLQMYAQRIDRSGKFEGKFELIDEIDAKSRSNAGSFMVWPSEDSSKFVIIDNPPFDKYNGEKFGFKIYDNQLKNQSNFAISLPYKDKDLAVTDFFVGNDSKIHLLTRIDVPKKQQAPGTAKSFYSIFTVNPLDKSISEYKIDLPKRIVENASLKIDNKKKEFICGGFYSDLKAKAKEGNDLDGFYFMRVNIESGKVILQSTKEIDKEMVSELISKKKVKEDQGLTKSFEIKEIETHSDGTTILIAENRRDVVSTTTICNNNGGCSTTTNYYYYRDNIFLINIAANGSVNSFMDIPKRQISANDEGKFLSFLTFKKDDRMVFIFNDNPANLNGNIKTIKDVKSMTNVGKASTMATEVNKNGGYSKFKLFDNSIKKTALLPESGIRVGNGIYIIPTMMPPASCSCSCFGIFSKTKLGIAKIEL